MDRNPYLAPSGQVEDPVAAAGSGRPRAIKIAVVLLVFQCLLTTMSIFAVYGATAERASTGEATLFLKLVFGVVLAYAVWDRQNWARITLAVLLLNKLVFGTFWFWAKLPDLATVDNAAYLASLASQVAVVVLLYMEAARTWFAGGPTADYRRRKQLTGTSGLGE